MKKILVFVLTVNLCSSQMLLLAGKTPADWKSQSRAVHSALYQAVLNEEEGRLDIALEHIRKTKMQDRAAAARAREEGARRGTVLFALDDGEERYIPVLRGMPFLYEGTTEDSASYRGLTLPKRDWAWAAIHLDLIGLGSDTDWYAITSWSNAIQATEPVGRTDGASLDLVRAIQIYGVAEEDLPAAVAHLSAMLKQKGLCEDSRKSIYFMDGKGSKRRADQSRFETSDTALCQDSARIMQALAVLSLQYGNNQAADAIYEFIKTKHRRIFGPALVLNFTALMMGMNTDYSYQLLHRFLREEARQTSGGRILGALGYLSLQGAGEAVQQAAGEKQYLDSYTVRFSYLDEEAAHRYMPDLNVDIISRQVRFQPGDPHQLPLGNAYEEVGRLLAQDAQNPRSARLCREILTTEVYNTPLVTGVLLADKGNFVYRYGGTKAQNALEGLLSADFLDLNEGTQRRLRESAAEAMYVHGRMSQPERAKYSLPDADKKTRYDRMDKVKSVLGFADAAIMAAFLPALVRTAAAGTVKTVNALRAFGGKTARFSSAAIRRGAAAVKVISPTISPQTARIAVSAPKVSAAKPVPAPIKSTAAESFVRVPAAAKAAPVPVKTISVSASARPAFPVQKKSLWHTFYTQAGENLSETVYDLKQILGDVWHGLKLKTGALVTAAALNVTAAPAAAEFAASGAARLAQTEQVASAAGKAGRAPALFGLGGTENFWQIRTQLTRALTPPPPFGAARIMTRGSGKLSAWNALREDLALPLAASPVQSLRPAQGWTWSALSSEASRPYWRAAAAAATAGALLTDAFTGIGAADALPGLLTAGSMWLFPEVREAVKKEDVDPYDFFHRYNKRYAPAEMHATAYEKQLPQYQAENFRQKYRLRESLVTEAVAWGLREDMANKYTKEQLLDYIITMRVSTQKAKEEKELRAQKLRAAVKREVGLAESDAFENMRGMYGQTLDIYEEVMADKGFIRENYIYGPYQGTFNGKLTNKISILLVNDSAPMIDGRAADLRAETQHVRLVDTAYSGNEAVKLLRENPGKYDIIFTDFFMPDGCGDVIARYVYENNLKPLVIYDSYAGATPQYLYYHHFHGKLKSDAQDMLNYASNMLTEGRANNKKPY